MNLLHSFTGAVSETMQKIMPSSPTASSRQQLTRQPVSNSTNKPATHERQTPARSSLTSILVLGRSGAGKTYFINHVRSLERKDVGPTCEKTMDVKSNRIVLSDVKLRLIDTPGFDNPALSDIEVFTQISQYLSRPTIADTGIHGIIYVHRAGDSLQSRALLRNVALLSSLFIGEDFTRLTIFVSQLTARRMDSRAIIDELRRSGSVFGSAYAKGANIVAPDVNRSAFVDAVMVFASMDPIIVPIQKYVLRNGPHEAASYLEDLMWHREQDSAQQRLKDFEQRHELALQELRLQLNDKDLRLKQYSTAFDEAEKLRVAQQETEVALRQQLQQVQQEYSSLRSQLQLQDNSEQSEIVQELKDLNREIDEIGRLISAHLTDNFVRPAVKKDPADITTLDAHDLSGLKEWAGHTDGKASLVASSEGVGMDVESFFDFAIRISLCNFLSTKIFRPFHPAIDSTQSSALLVAYADIQRREPQSVAGRWRSTTFKSIYKPKSPDSVVEFLDGLLHEFLRGYLHFIPIFLGPNEATLERQQFNRLHKLITRAWDWNSKLKGEVIVLGDFMQIAYVVNSGFDARLMEEFEPNPRKPHANIILGTLALGLISQRAQGGGHAPEENIVLKPLVITDNTYA